LPAFVLAVTGRDRPGIVSAVTRVLLDHRLNIEDAEMAILRGHFAVMLVVEAPAGLDADALRADLERARAAVPLETVTLTEVPSLDPHTPAASHSISVYGADHPGIVHGVASALAANDVNVVGLAAPQIGEAVSLVAIDVTGHPKADSCQGLLVLANPVIVGAEGDELGREGCLSIPDLTANVRRATFVRVEAITPMGEPLSFEANGFEARVVQHELDHLAGILFLDRIASKQDLFRRKSFG
jgi:peptide deformylase